MALLDGLAQMPSRSLPTRNNPSCGKPIHWIDRAIMVWEQVYQERGSCPDCCAALAEADGADMSPRAWRKDPI
jgi:hypothetical protein